MKNEPETILTKKKAKAKTSIQKVTTSTKKLRNNSNPVSKNTSATKQQTLSPSFSAFDVNRLDLQPLLHIQVLERLGINYQTDRDFNKTVLDLYNCIPGPVNINNFLSGATTGFVVNWILNHFKSNKDTYLCIDTDHSSETKCITEYRIIDCPDDGACTPIGYLEDIAKLDKPFHDALLFVFQYINSKTNLQFMAIDDPFDLMSMLIDMHNDNSEGTEEDDEIVKNFEQYQSGIVHKYYKLINKSVKYNFFKIEKTILTLNEIPLVSEWFQKLIDFFKTEGWYNVHQFGFNYTDVDYENGNPIEYSQTVGFYWKQDYVFHEIDSIMNQTCQEVGILDPTWSKSYTTHGVQGEIKDSNWPAQFKELMTEFNSNVITQILKHYGIDESKY